MKKVFSLICMVMCCLILFGCSNEEKVYDQKFLSDFKKGLMDRWDLTNEIEFTSRETGEKFVDAELNCIEEYSTKRFEDTKLQEKAIVYINLLKQQREALTYYDVDVEKYSELWDEAYEKRSICIIDFIQSYNLEFSDKYRINVDEFILKAKKVKEDELLSKQIEEIKESIEFKKVKQSGSYGYYEAIVENVTEKTFDSFSIDVNLVDAEDVIVESNYVSVSNWSPGKKAKFEFMTDVNFETYELELDYYFED